MIPYEIANRALDYVHQTYLTNSGKAAEYLGNGIQFAQKCVDSIPDSKFSSIAIVAFSALAASVYLLRRRRK